MRDAILKLRNEVNCRIEHGAESGGHLEYVQEQLDKILEPGIDENASLAYLFGFADALHWAIGNPGNFALVMLDTMEMDGRYMQSVVFQASQIFDAYDADAERWSSEVPRDKIMDIAPAVQKPADA